MAVLGSDNITHSTTFKFNINSADRVTIDSSGRLLVNATTARTNLLDAPTSSTYYQEGVDGTSRNMSLIFGSNTAAGPIFILGKHRGTSIGANNAVLNSDELGQLVFAGSNGTNLVESVKVVGFASQNWGAGARESSLHIFTNNLQSVVVDAGGISVLRGGSIFSVNNGSSGFISDTTARVRKGHLLFTTTQAELRWKHASNDWKFSFQSDRNVVLYDGGTPVFDTGTSISDIRLKENIQSTQVNGINTIKQLNVVDFTWKENSCMCDDSKIHTGFIAQEVKEIIPDSVKILGEEDTHLLHKEELVPYLVKCIQEAIAKIEILEAKVEQLEAI